MEKKELVILCNNCHPIPSATGLLALNAVKFLKNKFNIRVIAIQDRNEKIFKEKLNGYELYTIGNWRLSLYYYANKQLTKAAGLKRIIYRAAFDACRVLGLIDRTLFHIDNYKWYQRKAYRLLKELNQEKKVDVIISVSEPVRTHMVAKRIKIENPDIRWVCYWGDLYATKYFRSNIFFSVKAMKRLEKSIIEYADYVLANDEIYGYYYKICKLKRIANVPYTLKEDILSIMDKPCSLSIKKTFAYFGSLSLSMRNPEFMLKLFCRSNHVLELYTAGCEHMIQKYVELSNGRIRAFGFIEPTELRKRIQEADVLVNLGNSDSDFLPSKTLELLSYRKPILDLYYGENEHALLTQYSPLLRIANDTDIESAWKQIDVFLDTGISRFLSANELREIFEKHTEQNVKKVFEKAVNACD